MAGQSGGSPPDLKPDSMTLLKLELLKQGHDFSFFQIVRLLRYIISQSLGRPIYDPAVMENIRARPNLSLAFPASDVENVKEGSEKDGAHFIITANFLGLYGTSSPLPTFYTEDLLEEDGEEDANVCREFFDIINQRLYSLLFECWAKYRLSYQILEENNKSNIEQLFCLIGLGDKLLRENIPESYRLLRYIGLFAQLPRSALGLKTLLRDALEGVSVDIIPCVRRTAAIPSTQRMRMGVSGCKLGTDSYLGDKIADRMGKFRVRIDSLSRAEFQTFVPGTEKFQWLCYLTEFYITEPLAYDVEVVLVENEVRTVCLGNPARASLGLDSWIFSGKKWGEVSAVFDPVG